MIEIQVQRYNFYPKYRARKIIFYPKNRPKTIQLIPKYIPKTSFLYQPNKVDCTSLIK